MSTSDFRDLCPDSHLTGHIPEIETIRRSNHGTICSTGYAFVSISTTTTMSTIPLQSQHDRPPSAPPSYQNPSCPQSSLVVQRLIRLLHRLSQANNLRQVNNTHHREAILCKVNHMVGVRHQVHQRTQVLSNNFSSSRSAKSS